MPRSSIQNVDDPVSLNVAGVTDLVTNRKNKILRGTRASNEGPEGPEIDELALPMPDEDLLKLAVEYEDRYKTYEEKLKKRQEWNRKYYLGRQLEGTQYNVEFPIAANLIFEAEETFLPAALSRNPEPVTWSDNTEQGTMLARDVKTMLQYHADVLVLRRKLAAVVRHWSISFIGVLKHGYNKEIDDISTEVRLPKYFIFDPDGSVDVYGDFNSWMGERFPMTARELADEFPNHKKYIEDSVRNKMGTRVTYTEWWSADGSYYFCTYMDLVLDKGKNPHFLYQEGENNHFAKPKKPYTFFSVFSLGDQPHDITNLIEQNIPNQNLVSKRTMQIDVNLSRANNSTAFSARNFNQQTAKQAAQAFEKGNPVLIPEGGAIGEAIANFPAPSYPQAAFTELENNKNNLRSSFGTQGITSQENTKNETARGLVLNQQRDTSRIGGGIGDVLEQVADNVFNWWCQMYHVYYDVAHDAKILGAAGATQYAKLSQDRFTSKIVISVAQGSMAPKDEVSEMNQAISLFEMGVLDPKTLLTILRVPDTQQTIENVLLWITNKQAYIAKIAPQLLQAQPAQMPGMPGQIPGAEAAPGVAQGTPPPQQPQFNEQASAGMAQVPQPGMPMI